MDSALLRCQSCRTLNRVPAGRLMEHPKCGRCKALLRFPVAPVEVTAATLESEVLAWPGSVLVEFWSYQCSVCRAVAPFVERLAREKAGLLKVALIDVQQEWLLAHRFDIRSTPVFMVFRNGTKINELYGALPRAELEAWIESAIR